MELSLIVAIDKNGAIGGNNELLWHLPNDLKNFKKVTTNHPVIMGRKTFESIINMTGKVLPNRTNIVISRNKSLNKDYANYDFTVFSSLTEALEDLQIKDIQKAFVIGGGEIYKNSLPYINKFFITLVKAEFNNADTFFEMKLSDIHNQYTLVSKKDYHKDEKHKYDYSFLEYISKDKK